jgi:hypothetical protein
MDNYDDMTLYVAMVEHAGETESCIQPFWTNAATIGAAIERIADGAMISGFPNQWFIVELDPYRQSLPVDAISVTADVWHAKIRHHFPSGYSFRLPSGVIKSCLEGEFELSEMVPGVISTETGRSIRIDAVVEAGALLDTYLKLVRTLGVYRVSWIKCHDDWESGGEVVYVNESIDRADLLESFMGRFKLEQVFKGHVTKTAVAKEGSTNGNLTDHKTIQVWSTNRDLCNSLVASLRATGLPSTERLIAIDHGFHHWHYRPTKSRDRKSLVTALRAEGFSPWQPKPLAVPDEDGRST